MICQTKCIITIFMCSSFFVLNIPFSYSLPNETQLKEHEQQSNHQNKRDDSKMGTTPHMDKNSAYATTSFNALNQKENDGLKDEMIHQVVKYSQKVNISGNIINRTLSDLKTEITREVDDYSQNITQSENKILEDQKLDTLLNLLQKVEKTQNTLIEKVNRLETSLNNRFDDLKTKTIQQVDERSKNLTNLVNSLKHKLEDVDMKTEKGSKYRLPDEIVQDIKSDRFSQAVQKLKQADDGTYKYAVHEVYNNQIDNVDLLQRFCDSIDDTEVKINIYLALHDEIKVDSFFNGNSYLYNASVVPNLISESILKKYGSAIHLVNRKCFQCMVDICEQVVRNLWNKLHLVDIMDISRKTLKTVDVQIAFQIALFHVLESKDGVYSHNSVTLARHMKLTMEDTDYNNSVTLEMKSQHEAVKNKLPRSVKNLVFSSKVCMKNTRYEEYLYAGTNSDDLSPNDTNFRYVYTRLHGDGLKSPEFKWHVSFCDSHQIHIRNDHFNKEYLIAYNDVYDATRRYAYTWSVPENSYPSKDQAWYVEVDLDNIYLKYTGYSEYLFADQDIKVGEKGRYAFTYRQGPGWKTADSVWRIDDCP